MNPCDVAEALKPEGFTPFAFVTSGGGCYEVRHPEMAAMLQHGAAPVFEPTESDRDDNALFRGKRRAIKLAYISITAFEPLTQATS